MKIGGYGHSSQTRDLTAGPDKRGLESRTGLPLSLKTVKNHSYSIISSHNKRAHVQAYLDNIQKYQEQFFDVEKESIALEKTLNKIMQHHKMILDKGNNSLTWGHEVIEIRDELSTCYQSVEMIRPELSAALSDLDPLLTPGENKGAVQHEPALPSALNQLEFARERLSKKKDMLQEKIAETMVAMENLMASQSLIRDEARASRVIDQLKVSIANNVDQSMLSQANLNRNYILNLIK